jgi:NADPH2:quinone reductase
MKPDLPFVPGSEVGGIVREVHGEAHVREGDRVAAFCMLGAWAQQAVAPTYFTFKIPDDWDYAQGAALVLNYHTAYFALIARGRLAEGETVVVHGAAGGVGTATLQVAKAWGARTIGVVSSDAKEEVARQAGADEVVRSDGPWKDEVKAMTDGGAHVVLDPVGGDRFTDSLRCLREGGRVVVVGFTGGSIPEVRVNRLLLNNTEVIGAGWGASVLGWPERTERIGRAIEGMIEAGQVRPVIGARFPMEKAADALQLLDERGATGKVVLDLK